MKKQKTEQRRLFLALWPTPDVRQQILDCQQKLNLQTFTENGARLVRAENFHLTLRFLGAVSNEFVEPLKMRLAGIQHPSFDLKLQVPGYFSVSRTLWLGLQEQQQALLGLNAEIDRVLFDRLPDYETENKDFVAHVSFCRGIDDVAVKTTCKLITWRVSSFALVESLMSDYGAEYHLLAEWPLQKTSPSGY